MQRVPMWIAMIGIVGTMIAWRLTRPPVIDLASLTFPLDEERARLSDIPSWLRALDGRRVCVTGYMIPMEAANIHHFVLISETQTGNWPPPYLVKQAVMAASRGGVEYCPDRIRVIGRLHVAVSYEDGSLVSLYSVDVDRIVPEADDETAQRRLAEYGAASGMAVVVAVGSVVIRRRWLRRRRQAVGCCEVCGYDLRASQGRCPECGQRSVVPTVSRAARGNSGG